MVGPHRRRLRPHLAQAWALREMCVYSHHTASRTSDHAKAAISSSGLILTVFLGADTPRSRSTGVSTELACPTHTCACPSPRSGHHWLPGQPLPCSHVRQRPHTLRWPAFSTGPAPCRPPPVSTGPLPRTGAAPGLRVRILLINVQVSFSCHNLRHKVF